MGATTTIASFQMSNGEGPVWNPTANTFFHTSKMPTDQNSRQVWKVDLTAHTQTSIQMNVGDNGMSLDNDNKIVAADHKMSAIVRLDPTTGAYLETIADRYNGAYFQSPNDVIVRGDGNIYFSDPAYFSSQGKTPKTATTAFYRISPAKVVSVVEDDGTKDPNGVVLSADDNTLYTVVTGDKLVKKWSLNADGSINGAGTTFVRPKGNLPDGMCMDCAGNLYVGTQSGVEVYSPTGTMLTMLGTNAVNCSFGGADHKTLFVTTDTNVWYSGVNIPGLP
jgi:gluconolactonase